MVKLNLQSAMKHTVLSLVCLMGSTMAEDRPNIVFLFTDDQRDGTLGAMGHPSIKTPHLDKMVESGVRFTNTYVVAPICAPSRVSVLTGMGQRKHGIGFSSSYELTEEQWKETYPALLRESGYYTGFVGKFGVEFYEFKGDAGKQFDFWRAHDGWAKFFHQEAPNCAVYKDAQSSIITEVMGESMVEFVAGVPEDKPFCLSVSFSTPHGSQLRSMAAQDVAAHTDKRLEHHEVYGSLYRGDGEVQAHKEISRDPYEMIPQHILNQEAGRKQLYAYWYEEEVNREFQIRYQQLISGIDRAVGELVRALEAKDLAENTVIIYGSDHGLLTGEYGMGGKSLLFDQAAKIPCFVYDPRQKSKEKGRSEDALVSSVDFTSTIMEFAGVAKARHMTGQSLVPLVRGEKVERREYLFLESLYIGRGNPYQEGIRKGKWKYIRMFPTRRNFYREEHLDFTQVEPGLELLFNLEEDPREQVNLVGQASEESVLKELRALCAVESQNANQERQDYMSHEGYLSVRR